MSGIELLDSNKVLERNLNLRSHLFWPVECLSVFQCNGFRFTSIESIAPLKHFQSQSISSIITNPYYQLIGKFSKSNQNGMEPQKNIEGEHDAFFKWSHLITETPWTWWKSQTGYGSFINNSPKMWCNAKIFQNFVTKFRRKLYSFFLFSSNFLANFFRQTMTSLILWQYPEGARNKV